ncbi:MAG: UDP-2,3-diacylglucosamine diphosphatase [Proteobacteria bacterium]|nr:UDP-2,3-diacylglucosamine diphosphatase [Pseudomonadota bacterium]
MHGLRGVSRYRSIWISDVHLGTRGCKAEFLLDFLNNVKCDQLYLVGDIVDGWRLKRSWYWPTAHNEIVSAVLDMAKSGTEVIYIPGNHDEMLREYTGIQLGGVDVQRECIHTGVDGRRYLVTHGDDFDVVVKYAKWVALLGDWAYTVLLWLNNYLNDARRLLGLPYWSLSAYLKDKVKNAVEFVSAFETALAAEANRRDLDGVVCGHIHRAEIRDINGIRYMNSGDWVESCTALTESGDGSFEIVRWAEVSRERALVPAAA